MALSNIVRRHIRDGMQLQMQETERRTGLSRNTISKYLRADTGESKFKGPTWLSKFDRFEPKLLD